MKTNFDDFLALLRKGDSTHWEVGDYIVRKLEDSDGLDSLLEQLSEVAAGAGFDTYTFLVLMQLHRMAISFPRKSRVKDLPYATHRAAGTPEILREIISTAERDEVVTPAYVRKVLDAAALKRDREFEREQERRRQEQDRARAEKDAAVLAASQARSEAERRAARERVSKADEELKSLARPVPKPDPQHRIPSRDQLPELFGKLEFERALLDLKRDALSLERRYGRALATFTNADADAAVEDLIIVAEAIRKVIERLQGKTSKGGHLNVVA